MVDYWLYVGQGQQNLKNCPHFTIRMETINTKYLMTFNVSKWFVYFQFINTNIYDGFT